MSLLLKIAGRPIQELAEPEGCYDDTQQMWSELVGKEGDELIQAMGTMQPATFSATSGMGRDRDMDDRGY